MGETGEGVKSREIDLEGCSAGLRVDGPDKNPESCVSIVSAENFEDDEEAFLEAVFFFLEISGSLMNMQSRPREEHLEQGYCRLHFTFDSAHA